MSDTALHGSAKPLVPAFATIQAKLSPMHWREPPPKG